MGIIPWGGFFGMIVGKITNRKRTSSAAYIAGFILAWALYFVGLAIDPYNLLLRHGLSFIGGAIPFYVMK